MPPIYVKGGVWTNVEDEILKAAVSKYGLNQWSRVASLLTKKNSKQAKARWNEWLNPLINKTDWSRQDDEKLLNLVKLLPNQWRSIAPIMGRTATHCVERYQKLLEDETLDQDDADVKLSGPGIESIPASGATVGDLNLNPESKPARPDDEELSDDDKEMLFEAKSRLANTKGKKAKRRERERMLEETKRISLLQKRRELKASGIKVHLTSRKKSKEFDYNGDIPFEHSPVVGEYDIEEESQENDKQFNRFENEVSRKGIDLGHSKKKQSQGEKTQGEKTQDKTTTKRELEGEEELYENRKRIKPELPGVKETQEDYHHNELSGIFTVDKVSEDIDDRITKVMKQIQQSQNQPSTLINHTIDEETQKPIPKNINKAIRELVKKAFSELPKPKNQFQVLPKFDEQEEDIRLVKESEVEQERDRLRNLELLRQVEEEKAKLRKTSVVQKGLDIPNPRLLRDVSTAKYSDLNNNIIREFQRLIKSDYKKYVDSEYEAEVVDELDEEMYERVHKEISKVIQSNNHQIDIRNNRHIDIDVKLDYSPSEILNAINSIKSNCTQLQNQITEKFPLPESENIDELYETLTQEQIQYKVYKHILESEDIAIRNRTDRLNNNVSFVSEQEQKLIEYIGRHRTRAEVVLP